MTRRVEGEGKVPERPPTRPGTHWTQARWEAGERLQAAWMGPPGCPRGRRVVRTELTQESGQRAAQALSQAQVRRTPGAAGHAELGRTAITRAQDAASL